MTALFTLAGWSMGLHILLSLAVYASLRGSPLAEALFTLPNKWAGAPPTYLALRLMRAKYFLPWVASPAGLRDQSLRVKVAVWAARATGCAFPLLILAFFGAAIITVGAQA